jgi:hypothetical protein
MVTFATRLPLRLRSSHVLWCLFRHRSNGTTAVGVRRTRLVRASEKDPSARQGIEMVSGRSGT